MNGVTHIDDLPSEDRYNSVSKLLTEATELLQEDPAKAGFFASEGLRLSLEEQNQADIARSYYLIGHAAWLKLDTQEAISNLRSSIQTSAQSDTNYSGSALACNLIGVIFDTLGRHHDSLEHHKQALLIFEDLHDLAGQADSLNSIGVNFARCDRHQQSLQFYQRSLKLREQIQDPFGMAMSYNNLGLAYKNLGDYDLAKDMFTLSAENFSHIPHLRGQGTALGNLASLHVLLEDYEQAHSFYDQSTLLLQDDGDPVSLAGILNERAKLFLQQEKVDHAFQLAHSSLVHAEVVGSDSLIAETHLSLSQICEARKDYHAAYSHLLKVREHTIKSTDDESSRRQEHLQAIIRYEQSEKERDILEEKNNELEKAHQKLKELHRQLELQAKELKHQSQHDALTGLYNRRVLDSALHNEFVRSKRYQHKLSVAICDIDNFKHINDYYSHAAGDAVLRKISKLFKQSVRNSDLVARFGGEEFVIVFPQTTAKKAQIVCEQLRKKTEQLDFSNSIPGLKLTISFGVSSNKHADHHEMMLSQADKMLLQAKRKGKNQVLRYKKT